MIKIKNIKCNLSNEGLDNIISKLKTVKSELKEKDKEIVKEMATFVETQVSNNLAATPYKDGNDDAFAYSELEGNKARAGMKGSQALYDEFGTGTKGEQSPHPEKGKFGLNAYNSGNKIKVSKKGEMFWLYNYEGKTIKTQGIPAGKQVFNASIMLKGKKNQIIKRRVGEVISKL